MTTHLFALLVSIYSIQEILNESNLKLCQAKDVRWLSHETAINNLRKRFPAVIASLQREATERTCVEAYDLAQFVCKYEFIASLYMLSDVLPRLAQLSKAFQTKDLDFSMVRPLVVATKTTIRELIDCPGQYFKSLPDVLTSLQQKECNITTPSHQQIERYRENVYKKFLSTLLQHLENRFPVVKIIDHFRFFESCTT